MNDGIEEKRQAQINTDYVLIKLECVKGYTDTLKQKGMKYLVDYFILGEGKFRCVHIIKKDKI